MGPRNYIAPANCPHCRFAIADPSGAQFMALEGRMFASARLSAPETGIASAHCQTEQRCDPGGRLRNGHRKQTGGGTENEAVSSQIAGDDREVATGCGIRIKFCCVDMDGACKRLL